MDPRRLLQVEGLAGFGLALGLYFSLGGPVWLLVVLALAPDLSMVGYLRGPRVGSWTYNAVHTYTLPVALGGIGYWLGGSLAIELAAIWAAHIGADRSLGYGLKFESGFNDTHLSAGVWSLAASGSAE